MRRRDLLLQLPALKLSAQTREERGKKLLEEVLAAVGGERFLAMQDRTESGRVYSFYHERLSGYSQARIYTRYLTRPEPPTIDFFGLRERQSFGKGREDTAVLFTENEAWAINYRGARPMGKDVEARFRESTRLNIFYILRQRIGEKGLLVEHGGTDVVQNQPAEILLITGEDNRTVQVFVHRSTKLPITQHYDRRDPKTRERFREVTTFGKYREVEGIQWPYHIQRERDGEKIYEIFSETVSINDGLTDELFLLPANIPKLKPV